MADLEPLGAAVLSLGAWREPLVTKGEVAQWLERLMGVSEIGDPNIVP